MCHINKNLQNDDIARIEKFKFDFREKQMDTSMNNLSNVLIQ